MGVVRKIHNRGANIVVESHAEILFVPGGEIHNWTNRFTGRIRAATIAEAPTNKRPRWGHYGKPLKSTIVSARPRFWGNGRDKQRVYGAVGSTAPHAYYVDQGTGVYAGNGPYAAKVLPPWAHGDPSLYEHTWRPGGPPNPEVSPVMIKGQKGQFFFDKGLKQAFRSMRLRAAQVPVDPKISSVMDTDVTGLLGFLGNTENNKAFRASLTEWREWRDEAFKARQGLNRSRYNARLVLREKAMAFKRRKVRDKNFREFVSTTKAAEARKKEQKDRLARTEEAKKIGKAKKAADEAKFTHERDKMLAQKRAREFVKGKNNVKGQFLRDPDTGQAVYFRVTWTKKNGTQGVKDFAV